MTTPPTLTPNRANARELLAAHDVEFVTVRHKSLVVATEALESMIATHDAEFAGYPARLARINDDREALAELQAALKGAT